MSLISGILFLRISKSLSFNLIPLPVLKPAYGILVYCPHINKEFDDILSNCLSNPLSTPFEAPERTMYRNIPHNTPMTVIIVLILFLEIELKISVFL